MNRFSRMLLTGVIAIATTACVIAISLSVAAAGRSGPTGPVAGAVTSNRSDGSAAVRARLAVQRQQAAELRAKIVKARAALALKRAQAAAAARRTQPSTAAQDRAQAPAQPTAVTITDGSHRSGSDDDREDRDDESHHSGSGGDDDDHSGRDDSSGHGGNDDDHSGGDDSSGHGGDDD